MNVISLRRITADRNHNAFTGACWFQGALYVAFRQGDAHVCPHGRLVVLRSRDGGQTFDTVAVIRGEYDTRDAHLYTAGDRRLFVTGFEHGGATYHPGAAWTDDGLHWSAWTRYTGDVANWILWRPRCFRDRFYCAGYGEFDSHGSAVSWFESADGLAWERKHSVHAGADQPNECYLDFQPNGAAALLMRREHDSRKPLLLRSKPPYREWSKTELDVPLAGPALWFVGEEIWISGRWFLTPATTHVGVFQIVENRPVLQMVLPSGPGFDCSYMGVARNPDNQRRFALSYYSGHTATADPSVDQWSHPDIYLADVTFGGRFIERWEVSDVQVLVGGLAGAACPDPAAPGTKWTEIHAGGEKEFGVEYGFVKACRVIDARPGVVYFVADIEVGPCDRGNLLLGYDGPVLVWLNGERVFDGPGTNPAVADKTSVRVRFRHGINRVAIALDTNGGRAWGIFARFEEVQT